MNTIKEFNRENLKVLRVELDEALKLVADKFGITLKAGNISFQSNNCTIKLQASTKNEDGVVMTPIRTDFLKFCSYYGLSPDDLDKEVIVQDRIMKIVGLKSSARKNPIVVEDMINKNRYAVPASLIQVKKHG